MKVMVFGKATKDTESETPPDPKAMEAMDKFNEALIAAGIVKEPQIRGGLKPTRFAKRMQFSGKNWKVMDGPFADTKEVVSGFWVWEVKSIEEAVEWVKKYPTPADSVVEIRPMYSLDDFADWRDGK